MMHPQLQNDFAFYKRLMPRMVAAGDFTVSCFFVMTNSTRIYFIVYATCVRSGMHGIDDAATAAERLCMQRETRAPHGRRWRLHAYLIRHPITCTCICAWFSIYVYLETRSLF
jgi:hypothetical protein